MSFWMDKEREQGERVPEPGDAPEGAVISPDARREKRLPPGQSRTRKWPVLDVSGPPRVELDASGPPRVELGASGPPRVELESWRLRMFGKVGHGVEWNWKEFSQLPRVKVFADFHCVTRWSRLGNLWEGVSTRELVDRAGGIAPGAGFVVAHGYDRGFTTNLPLDEFLAEDALVAILHDGEPLTLNHGGPARLIVPRLYAWKSAKWLAGLELTEKDEAGFWERSGYHMHGDPWREERYSW